MPMKKTLMMLMLTAAVLSSCNGELEQKNKALRAENERLQKEVKKSAQERNFFFSQYEECSDCMAATLNDLMPHKMEVELDQIRQTQCGDGFRVGPSKIDLERGWIYLKYKVKGETSYSDKLPLNKEDRNILYVRDAKALVSVQGCDESKCTLLCTKEPTIPTCDYLSE